MKVVIVFKNGYELKITCENFKVDYDTDGDINRIKADEVSANGVPIYIDFKEILCIYKIVNNEKEKETDE